MSSDIGTETTRETKNRRTIDPGFVVALIGLALSIYLSVEHFTSGTSLACPEGATVNCTKVTTSEWSAILGVPVALLGLIYFVAMTLLVSPRAWRIRKLDPIRIIGGIAGAVMVLWLIFVELYRVNAICLWCTGVHVCTIALLGLILWRTANREPA